MNHLVSFENSNNSLYCTFQFGNSANRFCCGRAASSFAVQTAVYYMLVIPAMNNVLMVSLCEVSRTKKNERV